MVDIATLLHVWNKRTTIVTRMKNEYYLRAIWLSVGKGVLTSEFYVPLTAGETETQVRSLEENRDGQAVRGNIS